MRILVEELKTLMKQDQNLLYWILMQVEKFADGYPMVVTNGAQYGGAHYLLPTTKENFLNIYNHILLLGDHKLAEVRGLGQSFDGSTGAVIDRITAQGHSFLNNIENDLDLDTSRQKYSQDNYKKLVQPNINMNTIFIGHGRSPVWRELSDFLANRLNLKWDEFNRESSAGQTTQQRLQDMLEQAAFAFLVMTAEDSDPEGNCHARANVIHEVGLFQGKLGFEKAIILLEEGCTEFSNIHGLTQIRFPKNKILSSSEEIRKVLEREGIL